MARTMKSAAATDPNASAPKKKGEQKKKSESAKGSAAGRNKSKCERYTMAQRRVVHKGNRLAKRLRNRRFRDVDASAQDRLVALFDANPVALRHHKEQVDRVREAINRRIGERP